MASLKWLVLSIGMALVVFSDEATRFLSVVGVMAVLAGLVLPSRKKQEQRETARCREAARRELGRRVEEFNSAAQAAQSVDDMRRVLKLKRTLVLTDEEAGSSLVETMAGCVELDDMQAALVAAGGTFQNIPGHERIVGPDACFLVIEQVTHDRRGNNDPVDTLYLTDRELIFVDGDDRSITSWASVQSVVQKGRTLEVQRRDRKTPYVFAMEAVALSLRAEWMAKNILANSLE